MHTDTAERPVVLFVTRRFRRAYNVVMQRKMLSLSCFKTKELKSLAIVLMMDKAHSSCNVSAFIRWFLIVISPVVILEAV